MAIDFPNSPTNGQEFTSGGTSWVYDGTKWNIKEATSYSNDSAPVGTVLNFAGPAGSIPAGWIACDGSAVSRSTYATLFSVIGTTYGSGNGSTTFNLPDIDSSTGVFIIRWTTTLGVTATDSLYTAPVGAMLNWPTTSSYPTGWLRADGSAVSRTSYADLFILIGTTYGSGDGSTTFNLPNLVETGGPVTIIKATMSGGQPPSTVAHAASHIRGGTDIIDGDRVQVDYVPTTYACDSSDANAGATTDLTAHLKGIDNRVASMGWIATSTLASAGTTFTFSSIPSTFRSLVLIGSARSSSGGTKNVCTLRFNGDSGNNYAHFRHVEEPQFGGTYNINRTVTNNTSGIQTTSCASTALSPFQTTIHGYAQTNVHKSTTSQGMDWGNFQASYDGNGWVSFPNVAGLWKSNSAITSITVTFDSNVVAGSFFSLFGV